MRRSRALALLVAVVAGGLLAAVLNHGDERGARPSERARFAMLARQTSNRCDLQAREIVAMTDDQRLQGACCSHMEREAYRRQVDWLRRYRDVPLIPHDPYDIPASFAKRLLRARAIPLSTEQRQTYRRAMSMSREKGPCCCHCWRWEAFRGLSRYLITRRQWSADRLAMLVQALDGCGGRWPGAQLDRPA